MTRLLVSDPAGGLELIRVGEGGGYFDVARVLWDERSGQPMSDALAARLEKADARRADAARFREVQAEAQTRLDAWARTRAYDGILSACSYATSTVPKFAAEGQRAVLLRDQTWAACYALLAEVESGERPLPTLAEAIAELPALTWGDA